MVTPAFALALSVPVTGAIPLLHAVATDASRQKRRERAAIAVQFLGLGGLLAVDSAGSPLPEWSWWAFLVTTALGMALALRFLLARDGTG